MNGFMNMKKALLFALTLLALFLLSCSSTSDASSCQKDSDCAPKNCQSASCAQEKCAYSPDPNCCGNGKKEQIEDGKTGNECTCPSDFGACSGAAKIQSGSRTQDAKYVKRYCNPSNQCVLGVDPKALKSTTLLDENAFNNFDLEITTTLNQPFRVPTDTLSFRIRLKDAKPEMVYPIKFTHISLRDGELLFGERDLTSALGGVGDIATFNVPLSYRLSAAEETRRLSYQIDYEYTINTQERSGTSSKTVPKTSRETIQNRFSTPLLLAQDGAQ